MADKLPLPDEQPIAVNALRNLQGRYYQHAVSEDKGGEPHRGDHEPNAASPPSQQSPHDNKATPNNTAESGETLKITDILLVAVNWHSFILS